MNSMSDYRMENSGPNNVFDNGDVFSPRKCNNEEVEAKQRTALVQWLNSVLANLSLPTEASEEELRACLIDGTVLFRILSKLKPGSVNEGENSLESCSEKIKRFLKAIDEMGLPKFEISDLEKGSMKPVIECLSLLRVQFSQQVDASVRSQNQPLCGEDRRRNSSDSKFQRALRSPIMSEPSAALLHHVGLKFHEVFQLRQGRYADLPAAKISEMMKSNSLDNAPTQSLLSVVNGILDESIERKNGEIPHRVACLLRKVVQEIERRISTQAEHLRTQNNLFKAREEKYHSRIKVLEALATGTSEETEIVMNHIQQIKNERTKIEEQKKLEEQDVVKLIKEKDQRILEISTLKQELESSKNTYEQQRMQMETQAKVVRAELDERIKELVHLFKDSNNRVKELEAYSMSECQGWNKKEYTYKSFLDFQFDALRELKFTSENIKKEVFDVKQIYSEEFNQLGAKLKGLVDAAENYHAVLAENRRLHNEVQDLKGNIRVYCRIRPLLPGDNGKQTTIEYIGENGELVVASKQGKDGNRLFKFNKVFGPASSQAEVFSDTQPLIRSVLDGYNVCIFAYGQTGSGKTYTMTGREGGSKDDWGVNYRALNDLFDISQNRRSTYFYQIGVQMVEIYNEQVRDLLSNDNSQKRLGILTTAQPNGLAVPDASMHPVESTSDVLELMEIGLRNRAVGATALNERSSRSHSVITIHVRGTDLKTKAIIRGSLHLVDLAGSERVDRSEATGERLKEAQHINKSLSALGDVIFALAQKSPHVPYRNSKLTQVLQSSLGGQAKTLMFVQLNPDVNSYSETISSLKFAERVSGVELGAARSNKEGRDVRELMDQVASLKDAIAKKDEEIERLQLLKDLKNVYPNINEKHISSLRCGPLSPRRTSISGVSKKIQSLNNGKGFGNSEQDNCSENSDKHFEGEKVQHFNAEHAETLECGDAYSEDRLSDVSDGVLSVGTENEGSSESILSYGGSKLPENSEKSKQASRIPRTLKKPGLTVSTQFSTSKDSKASPSSRKNAAGASSPIKPPKRWQ